MMSLLNSTDGDSSASAGGIGWVYPRVQTAWLSSLWAQL